MNSLINFSQQSIQKSIDFIDEKLGRFNDYVFQDIPKQIIDTENKTQKVTSAMFYGISTWVISMFAANLASRVNICQGVTFNSPILPTEKSKLIALKLFFPIGNLTNNLVLTLLTPYQEEVLFRQYIQTDLLKNSSMSFIPKMIKDSSLNTEKVRQFSRVLFTSTIFSLFHLQNLWFFPKEKVITQLIITLPLGIICGIAQEKQGIITALTTHSTFNAISLGLHSVCAFSQIYFNRPLNITL